MKHLAFAAALALLAGPGTARVGISAIGIVNGGNIGQMHSWAAKVGAAPVP